MEFLKEWTVCVCMTLMVSVILSLFAPRGKMNGFYKIMISLFIFLSFLYPFKDFHPSAFHFDSTAVTEDGAAAYETMLASQVKQTLSEHHIIGADVSASVTVDYRTGEAEVKSVQVAVSDEYDLKEVENIIFDALGINARVIHIGQ